MSKTFTRVLVILVAIGGLIWFFNPRAFNSAASSVITSVDSSVAQAQGLAQFFPTGTNDAGTLQVKMDGLNPNTAYEVTLDQGHCGATSKDLGLVNTDGNGSFYNEFSLPSFKPDSTWYVNIHQQNANGSSVACGQLQTNADANPQVIDPSSDGSQPLQNDQTPTPALTTNPTPTTNPIATPASGRPGLPNTGADPGDGQQYDNHTYPRKY